MSRINGCSSDWSGTMSTLASANVSTSDLQVFHLTDPPTITSPYAAVLIPHPGRLRKFACDLIISDSQDGAIRTTFYDTDQVPTGSEPVLYSMISYTEKVGAQETAIQTHDPVFPGEGIQFKRGIGVICQRILNSPTIVHVDAVFYYHPNV